MNAMIEMPEQSAANRTRIRALVFLVLAVIAGGAALWLLQMYMSGVRKAAGSGPTVPVVVAAIDVPVATRLEEKHIQIVQWPKAYLPAGTVSDLKQALDHTVRAGLVKGEPVLAERLADDKDGRGLAALLTDGMRAMAVMVDSAVGVAGFVQPGDFVDVITTMQPDSEARKALNQDADKISKIILQNVQVLAVGKQLSADAENAPVEVKVVTLAVSPEASEKLALASLHGKITLTMRPRVDQKVASTQGVSPLSLLRPDDGSLPEAPKATEVAQVPTPRPVRRKEVAAPTPPPASAPVVEILRGGKVEERKLRVAE